MRVVDHFLRLAETQPDGVALFTSPTSPYTWGQLAGLTARTIEILQAAGGLRRGEHVASWLPNSLAWILVDLAAQKMGWVHAALDVRLPPAMAATLLEHSCARVVVSNQALPGDLPSIPREQIEQLASGEIISLASAAPGAAAELSRLGLAADQVSSEDPAGLLYTSGTISRPKGVLLSHGNLHSNAWAKLQAAPQFATDVRLNILPFAHAYARTCELSTWILSGSQLWLAPDWETLLAWSPGVQPTLVNLVPQLVYRLIQYLDQTGNDQLLGSRLRLLQVGGAGLRAESWQRLAQLGWPPLQGYGLTETSPVICSNLAGSQQMHCVGPPVPGVQIRLDESGVLWTQGPHVMLGYWRDPQATHSKLKDGWFCTGDLAERQEDGSLKILGRVDDQITLSTGYKVAPLELTARLALDPWIEHIVLVGQNQPSLGALVYPRLTALPAELFDAANAELKAAEFLRSMQLRLRQATLDLPSHMHIHRVALLPAIPTPENGALNFKGALRRAFIEQELYRDEVARLFEA